MLTALSTAGVWIVLGIFVAAAIVFAYFQLAGTLLVRRARVASLRHASERAGMPTKLLGKVKLGQPRLRAPLSGKDVAFYIVVVEELIADGQFLQVAYARRGSLLRITEDDQTVDVFLEGASIEVHLPDHKKSVDITALTREQAIEIAQLTNLEALPAIGRVTEHALGEDDLAYVYGSPLKRPDAMLSNPYRDGAPPSAVITSARVADQEQHLAPL